MSNDTYADFKLQGNGSEEIYIRMYELADPESGRPQYHYMLLFISGRSSKAVWFDREGKRAKEGQWTLNDGNDPGYGPVGYSPVADYQTVCEFVSRVRDTELNNQIVQRVIR
jgi:hypothetical protein